MVSEQLLTTMRSRLESEFRETAQQIADIDDELKGLSADDNTAEGVDNHLGDDADRLWERERLMTFRGELVDRRLQVQRALERVEAGTYGICERCGKPIAEGRLEARPFVTYCIECQEIVDRQGTGRR